MAKFYGTVTGNRGTVSRTGSKDSGITSHVRGWDIGAESAVRSTSQGDTVDIAVSCGSNGKGSQLDLGTFKRYGDSAPVPVYGLTWQLISAAICARDTLRIAGIDQGTIEALSGALARFGYPETK